MMEHKQENEATPRRMEPKQENEATPARLERKQENEIIPQRPESEQRLMAEMGGFTIFWRIENFGSCKEKRGDSFESSIFFSDILDKTEWRLVMFPVGTSTIDGTHTTLLLTRCDDEKQDIAVDCQIAFLATDSSDVVCRNYSNCVFRARNYWWGSELESVRFENTLDVRTFLMSQNILTIRCLVRKSGFTMSSESRSCYATTRIGVERRSYLWNIEGFSTIQPQEKRTVRLERTSEQMPPLSLSISIYQNELISCLVQQVCFEKGHFFPYLKVSALDASGEVVDVAQVENWFDLSPGDKILVPADDHKVCHLPGFNFTRSAMISHKELYLPEDIFSLRFECAVSLGVVSNQIEEYTPFPSAGLRTPVVDGCDEGATDPLKRSLQNLYKHGRLCDLTLYADGTKFNVHKAVLCARSPVLLRLFENWRKKQGDHLDIPYARAATVRHMLQFVYYDTFAVLHEDIAQELYSLAEKYEIVPLKEKCATFLRSYQSRCPTKLTEVSLANVTI